MVFALDGLGSGVFGAGFAGLDLLLDLDVSAFGSSALVGVAAAF